MTARIIVLGKGNEIAAQLAAIRRMGLVPNIRDTNSGAARSEGAAGPRHANGRTVRFSALPIAQDGGLSLSSGPAVDRVRS